MPNTYLGRRQVVFSPVICNGQPQSDPGMGCGTPMVSTTGLPLADQNTRRAAIRRIVRGAAKGLRIWLSAMVSGGGGVPSIRFSQAAIRFQPTLVRSTPIGACQVASSARFAHETVD